MAINNIYGYTSRLRLIGLGGSGLDTDTIVSQLMNIEKMPLNKLYQKKQLAEWKRDDYRSITNLLRGFKDEFLDVLKPATNMLSSSNYRKYTGTSSNNAIVTVSGNVESLAGSHTISVINLATAGKAESGSGVTDPLEGKAVSDYNLAGKKLKITLDGVTREITLDNYTYDPETSQVSDIVSNETTGLQALINSAFGANKIEVSYDKSSQKIEFKSINGASRITLAGGDALDELGFSAGASNRLDVKKSLAELKTAFANDLEFNAEGKLKFKINSAEFVFDKSDSLSKMMSTINSSTDAGVTISYDETTDKFTLTSKKLGAGQNITIDAAFQEGNFFGAGGASGIGTGSVATGGKDAKVRIDGQEITRSSNSFTVNGVTYNLLKAHTDPDNESETVSLSLDTEGIFNNIKSFVDKYNEMISTINTKLTEKYEREYQPLLDEQKSEMEPEDIKKWEEKAKTGLLRNDQLLQDIVYNMRRALSDSVSGISKSLSSIGITTGSYTEKGKLMINEAKLKEAISNDPEAVAELFTKQSDISYSASLANNQRAERYSEEGLAQRLKDIIDDNIRTVNGKGKLLEKAGIQGDMTEFDSMLYEEIDGYNKNISSLLARLADKEERYYAKFTAMEQAIARMNSQSSWLASQFGGNG